MSIRTIQIDSDERVETGAIRIKYQNGQDDWNGYFIRGDDAAALAVRLDQIESYFKENLSEEEQSKLILALMEISDLRKSIATDTIVGNSLSRLRS